MFRDCILNLTENKASAPELLIVIFIAASIFTVQWYNREVYVGICSYAVYGDFQKDFMKWVSIACYVTTAQAVRGIANKNKIHKAMYIPVTH